MLRARELRSGANRAPAIREFGHLAGALFVRTLDRSERIHQAMVSRDFTGDIVLADTVRFGWKDAAFTACWIAIFMVLRIFDAPVLIGGLILRIDHLL